MVLRRLGFGCFQIKANDTSLIIDPFDPKAVGMALPVVEADLVLYSDPTFYQAEARARVKVSPVREQEGKKLVEITEPGEYEAGGIFVQVLGDPDVAVINVEDVNICYVGIHAKLPEDVDFEQLPTIDYLIVPVGDSSLCLDWKVLDVVLREMEAGVVVPSCYREDEMKDPYDKLKSLQEFAEKFGAGEVKHEKKLSLQNVVLGEEETYEVIALDA